MIDPILIQPDLCRAAKYTVLLVDLPDSLPKFKEAANALLASGAMVNVDLAGGEGPPSGPLAPSPL